MSQFYWNKPIFILGNPRSGTSLLRLMLHNHSKICIPPESHFFLWLEEKYGTWDNLNLSAYLDDLFSSTKFETWNLNRAKLNSYLENHNVENYSHLNSLIYQFFGIKINKYPNFWGDKNSLWVAKLPQIKHYYSEVRVVHVIRDGRDVACSYKEINRNMIDSLYAPRLSGNITEIAKKWDDNNRSIERFLKTLSNDQFVQVKYEDVLNSPKSELQKILKLLQLNFEDQQLKYYLLDKSDIEPDEFLLWKGKLLQPPDIKNIGKYKKLLSQHDIDVFNKYASHSLMKYGYL